MLQKSPLVELILEAVKKGGKWFLHPLSCGILLQKMDQEYLQLKHYN